MVNKILVNDVLRDMTAKEQSDWDRRMADSNSSSSKLETIKEIRLEKLKETDWWVSRGNITTAQSDYRQALRDIPSTYSESDYDSLLAVNENGELTHTVWSKP